VLPPSELATARWPLRGLMSARDLLWVGEGASSSKWAARVVTDLKSKRGPSPLACGVHAIEMPTWVLEPKM
jgi:hypothetical protein